MTIDERLEYIATLQQSHDDQIGKLVEQGYRTDRRIDALTVKMDALTDKMDLLTGTMDLLTGTMDLLTGKMDLLTGKMDLLTDRTIQAMDSINRLGRIAEKHEERLDDLENLRPS